MQVETIKAFFTYLIALVVIIGGLIFLAVTRTDPPNEVQGLQTAVASFIGAALTFVFTRESSSQTSSQTAAAVKAASVAATNGNGHSA